MFYLLRYYFLSTCLNMPLMSSFLSSAINHVKTELNYSVISEMYVGMLIKSI